MGANHTATDRHIPAICYSCFTANFDLPTSEVDLVIWPYLSAGPQKVIHLRITGSGV